MIKRFNQHIQREQWRRFLWGVIAIGLLGLLGFSFFSTPKMTAHATRSAKVPDMTGATADDFTGSETETLQEREAGKITVLQHTINTLKAKLNNTATSRQFEALQQTINTLQTSIKQLKQASAPTLKSSYNPHMNVAFSSAAQDFAEKATLGITHRRYHYQTQKTVHAKLPQNYVPAGAFTQAVILGGADANASVNGQTQSAPILLRVLTNATLPNGASSPVKGCFVIASIYGDVSSERGEVRLTHLSCVKRDHRILDIPVEGTIFGIGGKNGVRGRVVMRNGKLLMFAGMSGLLSGIGSALQQSLTTQSISPLGSTQSINSKKVFQYGAYGGAKTALYKLSDYYIKRADQYHPVIEINAGTVVDIVFQKGFYLNPTVKIPLSQNSVSHAKHYQSQVSDFLASSHLGQTVSSLKDMQ